ncbi:RNA-directed DNA polymerase from mobile element jockey [Araneus ventricosus]|uniref:RNA-directed DNA polymerase from mobile element jockey n=1 Tax=Araneus ventricosus TaxID=182803 RepID=A0A4Y2VDS1_ARAVE|nr:RNA-directed DNA polymerase from mobile element jockey [Araneus ventricosus]
MASFVSWNCRGIKHKNTNLKDIINDYQPVCIALQETHLKDEDQINIKYYTVLTKNNINGRASGGVALLVAHDSPCIPLNLNTQLQAVAARIQVQSFLTICNLYLPPNQPIDQTHLNNLISQLPVPFLLLGDFNGHSPLWGSPDSNSRGFQIEQLLTDHNLCLINSGQPTYFHQPTRTFHVIDLAICSPSILPFLDLTIDDNLHNSDHFPVILTDNRSGQYTSYLSQKYVFAAANWVKFSLLANITSDMVENNTIDDAVSLVTKTIIDAANDSIPRSKGKNRKQNKPWWNNECQQAQKRLGKAWGKFRRYPTTVNLIAFKRSRADFRRIERYSKRTSWKSFVSSITSSISSRELWHKVKKAFGTPTSNPISVLCVNGQTISSLKGIANSIASTLANTSNSKNYNREFLNHKMKTEKKKLNFNSRSDYSYNCNFTFQEFQACLSKVHKSSPGPDNISYIMLLHLTTESQTNLLYLFNRIWNEQCFPSSWQEAIIIPIPKPGKDITNPLNYRPIALTSCLCKLLEKMINRRLTHFLETKNLLSPFQSGFRKGRSTLDNILALETDIRLAFLQRKHLVAIYFDIEKAYDRTWRYGILKDLYDSNLRGNLPIFIENFLRLRKFRVRLASEMSDYFIQEEGVPQGSILSVTLFILKINNVLNQLPLSIKGYLYVDDLCIFCTGMNMNCIQRQLQTAINNISQWADNNGFTISASKTAAVHFCRKRNLHLDPELQLNGVSIPFLKEIRFLGVVFDNKLSFLPHVMQLRKKCEKSLNILKVLSTTAWGADRPSMLRIYKATILSKLDYGCQIYGSARKSVLQKLDPIHHAALRICSGAFRTSPVQSLYVDCFEPALNYRRQMLSLHYYFRIKSNTYHPFHNFKLRPFLVRLQEARKCFIPVFFSRVHNILTDLNLLYVHVTIQPKRNFPPWKFFETHVLQPFENFNKSNTADIIYQKIFIEHREHYNSFVPIYTDGSKSADQVSFAVVFPNTIFSFRLHPSCSIFTAEITAVLYALEQISKSIQKMFIIYTDSLSVLKSLDSVHDHTHPLVFSVLDILETLASQGFIIYLCWIPSHVGIFGNEQADKAAKSATLSINGTVPVGDLKKHIQLLLYAKWQEQWNVGTGNKLHALKPTVQSWPSLKNRKADTILTRLRVGHTRFTHRHLLLGEQAPMCSQCNCTMSVHHIISECSNFNSQRLRFFNTTTSSLPTLLGEIPHVHLFAFLKAIGFYSLI